MQALQWAAVWSSGKLLTPCRHMSTWKVYWEREKGMEGRRNGREGGGAHPMGIERKREGRSFLLKGPLCKTMSGPWTDPNIPLF